MNSLTKNLSSNVNFTNDERIGLAIKCIRRKHGKQAIRFGHERLALTMDIYGKRPAKRKNDDAIVEIFAIPDDAAVDE